MRKVGANGKYQKRIVILIYILTFVNNLLFFNTSFLFYRPGFQCEELGFSDLNCENRICQIDRQNIADYQKEVQIYSVDQQFGPFFCEKANIIYALRTASFIGFFLSFVLSSLSDRIGRKSTLMLSIGIHLLGTLILAFSFHISMVGLGLFLMGFGCVGCGRTFSVMLSEITDN